MSTKTQITKERIVSVAKIALLDNGINNLNIRDIAKKCNIATGTFYNYFPTKDDLLLTIFREDWKRTTQLTEDLIHSPITFKEKLNQIDQSLTSFVSDYLSTFMQLSLSTGKPGCVEHHKFDSLYVALTKMIDFEKSRGTIHSTLDSEKLAQFYLSNLIYRTKHQYITFDELFDNFML